jgi:3-hydroxyisobutyrate dehydrogenase-like beta-hydroxyacid dehydrogenase
MVLTVLGRTIIHAGGVGMGTSLKLAANLMLAHLVAGFSEGLLLVERAGLDPARYLEVLQASTFQSPWYQTKGLGLIRRDFAPHFALKHLHKDLRLMGELAAERATSLPITKAIEQLFAQSESAGRGEMDYSAVLACLEAVGAPSAA